MNTFRYNSFRKSLSKNQAFSKLEILLFFYYIYIIIISKNWEIKSVPWKGGMLILTIQIDRSLVYSLPFTNRKFTRQAIKKAVKNTNNKKAVKKYE